jgi:hypothetical protein
MQPRIKAQPAMRDVFEGQRQLSAALEQQFFVGTAKLYGDLGRLTLRISRPGDGDFMLDVEAHFALRQREETRNFGAGTLDVERRLGA